MASECAGEGLKGPWEEGVVGPCSMQAPWGEKIWEGVVLGGAEHTVVRVLLKFAPRSLQAEKAKGPGRLPQPFSRGCQTYWEACQTECGALAEVVYRVAGTPADDTHATAA